MAVKAGMDAKLYTGGALMTAATDVEVEGITWTERGNVKDLTLNLEKAEADITTRGNNGWRQKIGTLKDGGVEFQMNYDPDDAFFGLIQAAWSSGNEIAIAVMDGAIAPASGVTSQGLVSNFVVLNFSRNEALEEGMTVDVTIAPSSYSHWYSETGA